jgi:hypothetical protein
MKKIFVSASLLILNLALVIGCNNSNHTSNKANDNIGVLADTEKKEQQPFPSSDTNVNRDYQKIYSSDNKFLGSRDELIGMLGLENYKNEFTSSEIKLIENCFIEGLQKNTAAMSMSEKNIKECFEMIKLARQKENSTKSIFSKDGFFIMTKKTLEETINTSVKQYKVKNITKKQINNIVNCAASKMTKMNKKEIESSQTLIIDCIASSYSN